MFSIDIEWLSTFYKGETTRSYSQESFDLLIVIWRGNKMVR